MKNIPIESCIRLAKNNPPYHFPKEDSHYKESTVFESIAGFRFEETRNLKGAIAAFILPRLAYLRDTHKSVPIISTLSESWKATIDSMVDGFFLYLDKDRKDWSDEDCKTWECAKNLFCTFFDELWDY